MSRHPGHACALLMACAFLIACAPAARERQLQPPSWWGSAFAPAQLQDLRRRSAAVAYEIQAHGGSAARWAAPQLAGPPLAASIRYSRAQARQAGARALPADVRTALAPFFRPGLVDEVRWTLAGRRVSLGTVLAGWYYTEGAVTLDDVVVYSDPKTAENLWLWAHELTHVQQYERLGINGFAARYSRDWSAMEHEASQNAFRITAALRGSPARQAALGRGQNGSIPPRSSGVAATS